MNVVTPTWSFQWEGLLVTWREAVVNSIVNPLDGVRKTAFLYFFRAKFKLTFEFFIIRTSCRVLHIINLYVRDVLYAYLVVPTGRLVDHVEGAVVVPVLHPLDGFRPAPAGLASPSSVELAPLRHYAVLAYRRNSDLQKHVQSVNQRRRSIPTANGSHGPDSQVYAIDVMRTQLISRKN